MSQYDCRYVGCIGLGGFDPSSDEASGAPGEHVAADVTLVVSLFKGVQAVSQEGDKEVLFGCAVQEITECNVPETASHICCFVRRNERQQEVMHAFQFDTPEKAAEIQQLAQAAMAAASSRQLFSVAKSESKTKAKQSPAVSLIEEDPATATKTPKRADLRRRAPHATPNTRGLAKVARTTSLGNRSSSSRPARAAAKSAARPASVTSTSGRIAKAKAAAKPAARSASNASASSTRKRKAPTTSMAGTASQVTPRSKSKAAADRPYRANAVHNPADSPNAGRRKRAKTPPPPKEPAPTPAPKLEPDVDQTPAVPSVEAATMTDSVQPVGLVVTSTEHTMNLLLATMQQDPSAALALVDACIAELNPDGRIEDSPLTGLENAVRSLVANKDKPRLRMLNQVNLANIITAANDDAAQAREDASAVAENAAVADPGPEKQSTAAAAQSAARLSPLDQESSSDAVSIAESDEAFPSEFEITAVVDEAILDMDDAASAVSSAPETIVSTASSGVYDSGVSSGVSSQDRQDRSFEGAGPAVPMQYDGVSGTVESGGVIELARHAIGLFNRDLEPTPGGPGARASTLENAQRIEERVSSAAVQTLHRFKQQQQAQQAQQGQNGDAATYDSADALDSRWMFIDTFFLTYRIFLDRVDLMAEIHRCAENTATTRMALRAAIHWTTYYWVDFAGSGAMQKSLLRLIRTASAAAMACTDGENDNDELSMSEMCAMLDHTVKTQNQLAEQETEMSYHDATYGPTENVVARMRPESVAEQLTLLNHGLLSKVNPLEFMFKNFKTAVGNKDMEMFDHLDAFIARFDAESYWAAAEIQLPSKSKDQASMITKFIKVAMHCKTLGNFFTVFTIVGALNFPEIRRLKPAWEKVSDKHKKNQADLEGLMNPSRNMKAYRQELQSHDGGPVVPFLPLHLKDIVFAKEAGDDKNENGAINFTKMALVARCVAPVASVPLYTALEEDLALQTYFRVSLIDTKVPFNRDSSGRKGASLGAMKQSIRDSFLKSRGEDPNDSTSSNGVNSSLLRRNRLAFWRERKKLSVSTPMDDVSASGFNPFMGGPRASANPSAIIPDEFSAPPQPQPAHAYADDQSSFIDCNSAVGSDSATDSEPAHLATLMDDSTMVDMASSPARRPVADRGGSRSRPLGIPFMTESVSNSSLLRDIVASPDTSLAASPVVATEASSANTIHAKINIPPPPPQSINPTSNTPRRLNAPSSSLAKTVLTAQAITNRGGELKETSSTPQGGQGSYSQYFQTQKQHSPGPADWSAAVKRFELNEGKCSALDTSYIEVFDDSMTEI